MDPLRHLHRDANRISEIGGKGVEAAVKYDKYLKICEDLKQEATEVSFASKDPRDVYLLPNGMRNIYFLPYLLIGEVIENEDARGLVFRSAPGIPFKDEFDLQDFIDRFNKRLDEQRTMLGRRNFYVEVDLQAPEFNFEHHAFPFLWNGYTTDKNLAYRVRAFKFMWEHNLREFVIQFDRQFVEPDEARKWKREGNFFKLGLLFEVVLYTPRLWTNGMPATICFVKGFQIMDGHSGSVIRDFPWPVLTIKQEHKVPGRREEIIARLKSFIDIDWEEKF